MSVNAPNLRGATVARVVNDFTLVISRGSLDGVQMGQRFLVYALSDEQVIDPRTQEPLGRLELVRGTGAVVHLQDHIATIASDMTKPGGRRVITQKPNYWPAVSASAGGSTSVEEVYEPPVAVPFDGAERGDLVRQIGQDYKAPVVILF